MIRTRLNYPLGFLLALGLSDVGLIINQTSYGHKQRPIFVLETFRATAPPYFLSRQSLL